MISRWFFSPIGKSISEFFKSNFLNTIKEEKGIEKITKKLDAFYELEYDAFKKELAKQKVKISLGNENNEWREYFNTTKQKINELQTQINQTDKEIDKMVYELYELTPYLRNKNHTEQFINFTVV